MVIGEAIGYGIVVVALTGGLVNIAYGAKNLREALHCYFFFKGIAVLYFSFVYMAIMFDMWGLDNPAVGRMFIRPAILTLLIFILTDIWLRRKKHDAW